MHNEKLRLTHASSYYYGDMHHALHFRCISRDIPSKSNILRHFSLSTLLRARTILRVNVRALPFPSISFIQRECRLILLLLQEAIKRREVQRQAVKIAARAAAAERDDLEKLFSAQSTAREMISKSGRETEVPSRF